MNEFITCFGDLVRRWTFRMRGGGGAIQKKKHQNSGRQGDKKKGASHNYYICREGQNVCLQIFLLKSEWMWWCTCARDSGS